MQIKNLTEMFRPVENADNRAQKGKTGRGGRDAGAAESGDRVSLSPAAQELKHVRQAAHDSPDARAERVDQIKGQVTSGTYRMNSRKTAEKMLEQENALWGMR